MSDPTLEEESLISQDDIDKLLDASSLEEAEESLDAPAENADLDMDEVGELSQDDIDSLLSDPNEDDSADDADGAGELSQDDIDSLLGGGEEPEDEEADEVGELSQDDIDSLLSGPNEDDSADDADEIGELSQDDIDSLLGGGDEPEDEETDDVGELSQDDIDSLLGGGGDDADDDDDMELISQDDIDSLVNGSDGDEQEDDDELISMDDIQDLIGGEPEEDPPLSSDEPAETLADETAPVENEEITEEEAPEAVGDKGASDLYDEPISEADALEVINCLIAQETMDELIRNAPELKAEPDPAPEAAMPMEDLAPAGDDEPGDIIDMGEDDGPVNLDASDDDLDNLLEAAGEEVDLDLASDMDGDVTQEDIDALLQESDDGDDFLDEDDDILISQDDIDTLLMAADQEDEDVLGDLLGDGAGDDMGDEFEDHEVISGDPDDLSDADQVVLEEFEGDPDSETGDVSERMEKVRALLKSKLVLAVASILLVLGISVPGVYFLFFSGKPVALPEKEVVPTAASQAPARNVDVASVTVEEDQLMPAVRQSGTIVLTDFIILSAEQEKDMTYIYADISIDYSDQRAYHEISNNLSFYRDLIYESIQTSLVSEKRKQVTESDLLWGVENSLKKVLPPHFIEKISFKTFRTS